MQDDASTMLMVNGSTERDLAATRAQGGNDAMVDSTSENEPEYGPDLWLIRRRKWLNGTLYPNQTPVTSSPGVNGTASSPSITESYDLPPSTSPPTLKAKVQPLNALSRLSSLLSQPSTPESSSAWTTGGLSKIHQSLMDGKTLKTGLKLSGVIVILRAGWVRDGTWPSVTVNVPGSMSAAGFGGGSSAASRITLDNGSGLGLAHGMGGPIGKKPSRRKAVAATDDPFFATPPAGAIVGERDGLEIWRMPGEKDGEDGGT